MTAAFDKLDKLADGASFILGHNLIAFDLPHLSAANPNLRLLRLPMVDTLRLSPLAFPRHPYHHLVKHYKDGGLKRGSVNNPELDARLALEVFDDQRKALFKASPDLLTAWHWLCTPEPYGVDRALDELFGALRQFRRPSDAEGKEAIGRLLDGATCATQAREILARKRELGWPLAYALAWISVAGSNSVMPPWVRHQFPLAGLLVRRLRDTPCPDPECRWCRERHDARKELKRWFGFDDFRPEPATVDGRPMQQAIVEDAMAGKHVLGILPTGTGKSLCYQIPALSRYDKTGALTVVISPLVALMADQVAGLEKSGIGCCVTINGLLSIPERADALDRVRLGDAGILLISPEQLRNRALRGAIEQREIGAWVLDEAHCLSRWGHDFRPDYRYVARFIKKGADEGAVPPITCLTATAKPDVTEDIVRYFGENLGIELSVFDGGAERTNLAFQVMRTTGGEKFAHIQMILETYLPDSEPGGAIIYCATRNRTEMVSGYLQQKEWSADYFHAGLPPERKKDVQRRFIEGELRVIAATNAFGMGIDKPNVRLVIHSDIPGSLENYFQEAGRAGRDSASACCVLLYSTDDVERQFSLSAHSRLSRQEIHGILRALRQLDRRKRFNGVVVATAGEILIEDEEKAFERDSATDDTRVRTAVAWLEEADLVSRDENFVRVFPSSLKVGSDKEAKKCLEGANIADSYRQQLMRIAEALIGAEADRGITTDELMCVSGLSPEGVRGAMYDLERLGIASNDTALTAFVHRGVARSSKRRLEDAIELETALITHMREAAPELGTGETSRLQLRIASQVLREQGLADPLPERLWSIVRGIAYDGRNETDGAGGSLTAHKLDPETARITLRREWQALENTANVRREAAGRLLNHLLDCLPAESRGIDLLAETTLGKLLESIVSDLALRTKVRSPEKLLDRALLWLHEQEVIRLNKGFAVFRPAMTIHLAKSDRRRGFSNVDYQPLALHYKGQVLQVHIMKEYAERGLIRASEALKLAMDYFSMNEEDFLARWLPGRDAEIGRATTPESWRVVVESLKNPVQQRIVADNRKQTNVLVLAGPGSGKTRVLVHHIAYLIRVLREKARGILALVYNRHAAVEIRRRLGELVGDDARGVTVLTCHALAMRLAGASFSGNAERPDSEMFRNVLRSAIEILRGNDLLPDEADARRERLLAGFRWILVDEYQDIGSDEYDLISALAGRTLDEDNGKLSLFAVGDDDQNIYAFNGASVEYIRRFEADYGPKPAFLTENYRSTRNIIDAANAVIEPARERMKANQPIRINRARAKQPRGGEWEKLDPVARGRVQILPKQRDFVRQAQSALLELQRLAELSEDWDWTRCAVIAREWQNLIPVRAYCELHEIPAQMGNEPIPSFWRLRESAQFLKWLRQRDPRIVDSAALRGWTGKNASGPWNGLLRQAVEEHSLETGESETPVDHFIEWLAEWSREVRRQQQGLLLLTAHRAKGLEFDHVVVLDGGWNRAGTDEDADAPRRLYYVAMTRAKRTLALARLDRPHRLQDALLRNSAVLQRERFELPPPTAELEYRYVQPELKDVDLGYAGRRKARHPIQRAIADLSPGDQLKLREPYPGRWELQNSAGETVGRLAKSFRPPGGMRCRSAEVFAVVTWSREASEPKYHNSIKCDSWEAIVPELVFERCP